MFAWVVEDGKKDLAQAVGSPTLESFIQLSRVHRDGWGFSAVGKGERSYYISHRAQEKDRTLFEALVRGNYEAGIMHQRLASPGIDLALDKQHPFLLGDLAFAHNGTLGRQDGNIVDRPLEYRHRLGLAHSTTASDSRLFGELLALELAKVQGSAQQAGNSKPGLAAKEDEEADKLCTALRNTLEILRQDYPDSSYNCLVQGRYCTLAAQVHGSPVHFSEALQNIYLKAGWKDYLPSYYDLYYKTECLEGCTRTFVSSSGYADLEGWTRLENKHVLVLNHQDGSARVLAL